LILRDALSVSLQFSVALDKSKLLVCWYRTGCKETNFLLNGYYYSKL